MIVHHASLQGRGGNFTVIAVETESTQGNRINRDKWGAAAESCPCKHKSLENNWIKTYIADERWAEAPLKGNIFGCSTFCGWTSASNRRTTDRTFEIGRKKYDPQIMRLGTFSTHAPLPYMHDMFASHHYAMKVDGGSEQLKAVWICGEFVSSSLQQMADGGESRVASCNYCNFTNSKQMHAFTFGVDK